MLDSEDKLEEMLLAWYAGGGGFGIGVIKKTYLGL